MRKSGFFPRLALVNLLRNGRYYGPYLLSCGGTAAMFYILRYLTESDIVSSVRGGAYLQSLMYLGCIVVALFSVVLLLYANSFVMKRRQRELGLYNILGLEKRHIALLCLWETLYCALAAIAGGIAAGILFSKLTLLLLLQIARLPVEFGFEISVPAIFSAASLFAVLFALTLVCNLFRVGRARPVELLHSEAQGEREPRTRRLLVVLGLMTLGGGYFLSWKVQNPTEALVLFFLAVVLVMIGTYCLFAAGSVAVLKALRANPGYYYQTRHFTAVAGLLHRMKQNAVGLANVCILSTMVLVMVFSTLSLWLGMEDTLNSRLRSDIDVRSASTDVSALEAAVDETLRQAGASREDTWTYRYLSFSALPTPEGFVSSVSFAESDALIASPATFQVMVVEDYNRMLGRSETLAPGEALLECTRGNYEGDTLRLLDETFAIKARISDGLGAGQALASIYDYYCLVVDSMDTLRRLDSEQQAAYGDRASAIRTSMSFALLPASPQLSEQVAALLRSQADADGFTSVAERTELRENLMTLYGGLLFVGLFLGLLFIMAMILIIYYKQITEGYEDRERYRIMRKVGLSRREIRRSISSQILIVFFLPLAAAGLHVAFAFPGIVTMFRALSMTNVTLIAGCALGSFAGFAALYGAVYLLTARVYYRIVSE